MAGLGPPPPHVTIGGGHVPLSLVTHVYISIGRIVGGDEVSVTAAATIVSGQHSCPVVQQSDPQHVSVGAQTGVVVRKQTFRPASVIPESLRSPPESLAPPLSDPEPDVASEPPPASAVLASLLDPDASPTLASSSPPEPLLPVLAPLSEPLLLPVLAPLLLPVLAPLPLPVLAPLPVVVPLLPAWLLPLPPTVLPALVAPEDAAPLDAPLAPVPLLASSVG